VGGRAAVVTNQEIEISPMTSPEEGAVARKWLSDHVADLFAGSDYIDGAVVVRSLENDEALKDAACRS
jgi:hypothetical protein